MCVCTAWLPGKLAKQQPTAWNDHKPAALHRHAAPSEIAKKGQMQDLQSGHTPTTLTA